MGTERTSTLETQQLGVAPVAPPRLARVHVKRASDEAELGCRQQRLQIALLRSTTEFYIDTALNAPHTVYGKRSMKHIEPKHARSLARGSQKSTDKVVASSRSFRRTAWPAASQAVRYSPRASSSSAVVYRFGTDLPLRSTGCRRRSKPLWTSPLLSCACLKRRRPYMIRSSYFLVMLTSTMLNKRKQSCARLL